MNSGKFRTISVALLLLAAPLLYSRPLKVAFVGDPQVDDVTQLGYARRSIYKELRERKDLDLVIVLGDLVNDKVELLGPSKAILDSLPCPWFCVPGNHDRDIYRKEEGKRRHRDMQTFKKVIGYEDTTVVFRGVRFIMMNDIRAGKNEYEGGFRPSQKTWLDSVLTATPQDMLAVLSTHIPLCEFTDKDSVTSILSSHPKLLLMAGHTHQTQRHRFGDWEEVHAGAACGLFWLGVKDAYGIPDAMMNCGSPRGYYVASFDRRGGYSLEYKKVQGKEVATAWLTDDSQLVLNIFGGSMDGELQVKVPGVKGWMAALRQKIPAPDALEVIARNKNIPRKIDSRRNPDYTPMYKVNSPHVWALDLAGEAARQAVGKRVRIRYKDAAMKIRKSVPLARPSWQD